MRNWQNIDRYLTQLATDIYEQPEDPGHTALAQKVVDVWMSRMTSCKSVLDLGAGQGMCESMFKKWNVEYEGVALGLDVVKAQELGRTYGRTVTTDRWFLSACYLDPSSAGLPSRSATTVQRVAATSMIPNTRILELA